jgi:hypothetical protein
MARSCGDDMTKTSFLRGPSSDGCPLRPGRVRSSCVCPAKGGVDTVHTLSTTGFSTRILIPSSGLCLHYFMQFSVSDDMTLRPTSSVSVDAPGLAGTSPEVSVAGVRSVDRVQVCGIRTLLPGSPGLVDPPDCGPPGWQRCSFSLKKRPKKAGLLRKQSRLLSC